MFNFPLLTNFFRIFSFLCDFDANRYVNMLFKLQQIKISSLILSVSLSYTFSFYFFTEAHKNSFVTLSVVDGDDPRGNESYELEFFNFTQYDNISYDIDDLKSTEFEPNKEFKNSLNWKYSRNYFTFITTKEDICTCDLLLKICDINCCCDLDCTEEDMKVFSKCESYPLHVDPNRCCESDFLLKNNIPNLIKEEDYQNDLLCILHDNLQRHLHYKDLPFLRSHNDLQLLLEFQSKSVYSWEEASIGLEKKEIKAGSPLYIFRNEVISESPWSLPSSCFSRMCTCNEKILYLEDSMSSCVYSTTNLTNECENNSALSGESYTNFCITVLDGDLSNVIILIKNKEFSDKDYLSKICVTDNFDKPKFHLNMCCNIVKDVHFTVFHNGTFGIVGIEAKVKFVNVVNNSTSLVQHFKVEFKWHNSTDIMKKSGNPGYQIGLPILMGTNISNNEHFALQTENLSVVNRNSRSLCNNKHTSIKFGKNFKTNCRLKTEFTNCKSLQETIFEILLKKDHNFVGIFGNANKSNNDEWVEAYHVKYDIPSVTECYIITSLKIKIAYAAIGMVVHPQFKILGLGYYYGKFEISDRFCNQLDCNIVLSTSVSFYDLTDSIINHHRKIPSLKANVPADFFYPFLQES